MESKFPATSSHVGTHNSAHSTSLWITLMSLPQRMFLVCFVRSFVTTLIFYSKKNWHQIFLEFRNTLRQDGERGGTSDQEIRLTASLWGHLVVWDRTVRLYCTAILCGSEPQTGPSVCSGKLFRQTRVWTCFSIWPSQCLDIRVIWQDLKVLVSTLHPSETWLNWFEVGFWHWDFSQVPSLPG